MLEGYIHSTESLGTRDGPGIRFVVFMQGCPMRCKYCHNPDTWKLCNGTKITIDELMTKIKKCKPYISRSNGGITISGGEPTLQFEFVLELLKRCKEEGLHTAIDTSGYVDPDKFKELLPYLDLILMDIKEMDEVRHMELTGVSYEKTMQNIELMEEEGQPYWIRYVVVPGYTDNEDDLEILAQYLSEKEYMEKLELLPYHNLGEHKWQELGLKYELKDVVPPSKEMMERIEDILKEYEIVYS
ncbi:MAG: pyruvate formate-lyase-activating protein [Halanaerobiales bacterium]